MTLTTRISFRLRATILGALTIAFVGEALTYGFPLKGWALLPIFFLPMSIMCWQVWRKRYEFLSDRIVMKRQSTILVTIDLNSVRLYRVRRVAKGSPDTFLCGVRPELVLADGRVVSLAPLAYYEERMTQYFRDRGVDVEVRKNSETIGSKPKDIDKVPVNPVEQ